MHPHDQPITLRWNSLFAVLGGLLVSFTLLSAYLTVEQVWVVPQRQAAEIERRDERVREAIAAGVGQDEFWKATLWESPSRQRQIIILVSFTLPAAVGALLAAITAPSRTVRATSWVSFPYAIWLMLYLNEVLYLNEDEPPPPVSELATIPLWMVILIVASVVIVMPLGGAILLGMLQSDKSNEVYG